MIRIGATRQIAPLQGVEEAQAHDDQKSGHPHAKASKSLEFRTLDA
jgi:hypothetical protein